ncbi:CUE domain-containing protein 2 [Malaya genurostris]|uniref:CUE domain-containing protein 2 n=1 Tax=Malaya genurostris TaxID=325434 RepID=UPI0026F3FC7D|nr:CUE domain-containing protein 2 [Malaya genurostris]XP_058468052.1 CUE domain-containing protein 2 [Malaya genurostris]XP_058468053.1 CUE domain-containing protein 2 [Malaya genurostris]
MSNIAQQHDLVKNSLFQFINTHIPGADLGIVDDIVLSYVTSILEEASQDPCFDVEGFIEMMSAYFNDFANIESSIVCTWIFQLENQLSKKDSDNCDAQCLSINSLSLADILPEEKLLGRQASISELESAYGGGQPKRVQHLSETSDAGSTDSSNCDLFNEECEVLQEMFPESSIIEVKHCILIANGDVDRATQILLHRQEAGQSLKSNSNNLQGNKVLPQIDETELKNRIISRYSYVDKEDHREYKPVAPKVEPKKLIRYRDNKIVSLKGERYTEVSRRGGDEETELKKPKKQICP